MSARRVIAVLIALAVATWWCWESAPPKHDNLPPAPLMLHSEIG